MSDSLAIAVFALPVGLVVAIHVVGKLFPRLNTYRLVGILCLLTATAFLGFVGWYFATTGMLVSPGGRSTPPRLVPPSDSVVTRLIAAFMNLALGLFLAWTGVFMLKLKGSSPAVVREGESSAGEHRDFPSFGSVASRDRTLWRVSRQELVRRDVELQRQIQDEFAMAAARMLSADEQWSVVRPLVERRAQILNEFALRRARWRSLRGPLCVAVLFLAVATAYMLTT